MRLLLFLLLFPVLAIGQTLTFCENVTRDGLAIHPSDVFNIGKKGGYFDFLITSSKPINTTQIKYDIFKIDTAGKETYDATYFQKVAEQSLWISKEITFLTGGQYNVYVYNADDKLLCVGKILVILKD